MAFYRNISGMLARKTFHLLGSMVAPMAALVVPRDILLWGIASGALVLLSLETARFASPECNSSFTRLLSPLLRKQEVSGVTGSTYVLISSFLTFFLFPRDIAILAISFLAVGDAFSAVVGAAFVGKTRREKNGQGTLACFLSSALVGLTLAHFFLDVEPAIVLIGAAIATLVEAWTLRVNDNITIPVSSAVVMTALSCAW